MANSFSMIKLYVADHAKLVKFYCDVLGMTASNHVIDGEGEDEHEESILTFGELFSGSSAGLCIVQEFHRPAPVPGQVTTWFWVDDAAATEKAAVEHGGSIAIPLFDDLRFDTRISYFNDPEGNRVQVAQKIGNAA